MLGKSYNKVNFILLISFIFLFCITNIKADLLDDMYYSSKEIKLIVGETRPLSVNSPKQVKIGNPELLDVVGAGQKELLLSGLAEGETSLAVVDAYGEHNYTVLIFVEDLDKVKERVDFLLEAAGYGSLKTQIAQKERKIFISGTVLNSQKEDFENKITPVSDKIVNLTNYEDDEVSVEIDVEVLEMLKTDIDTLGISWNKSVAFTEGGTAEGAVSDSARDVLDPTTYFKVMKDWRTGTLSATLNLLKQNNKAKTLSRPKIVCLSGKEAELLIGGQAPIIEGINTSESGTVTYDVKLEDWGIQLSIKPIVKDNDEIQVNLKTEISEIDETQSIALSDTISTPGFLERSASTELTVLDGQTIFLAGLIKSKHTDDRDSVQGLGRIPILGALFRNKSTNKTDTEIVITLTPTIIRHKPKKTKQEYLIKSESTNNNSYNSGIAKIPMVASKEDESIVNYSSLIQNIIYSNVKYPDEFKNKNIGGMVKLSLHLDSSGELLGVVVMRSSGNPFLDEATARNVKKLSPFPAFPQELKLNEIWVDIPIIYELKNKI